MESEELEDRLEAGEIAWMKVQDLERHHQLVGEGFAKIWAILDDLVQRLPEEHQHEFQSDLDRIEEISKWLS